MAMSKQDYVALAKELKAVRPREDYDSPSRWEQWEECVCAVLKVCHDTNPRFDKQRFLNACNGE